METLEGLFKWSHDWEMLDLNGEPLKVDGKEVKIYQRVIGDADLQLARETSLRASALQRKKLQEGTGLDRASLVPNYKYMDKGEISALIVLVELSDIRRQADKDLIFPYPEPPSSNATLEEQENYQESIDIFFDERDKELKKRVTKLVELRKEELRKLPKDRLREIHETAAVESACRDTFLTILNEYMAYRGTFLDAAFTQRAYPSFNAFRNASPYAKRQIITNYADLELKGDQLKKLQEAQ
jgi:hypothetical protein